MTSSKLRCQRTVCKQQVYETYLYAMATEIVFLSFFCPFWFRYKQFWSLKSSVQRKDIILLTFPKWSFLHLWDLEDLKMDLFHDCSWETTGLDYKFQIYKFNYKLNYKFKESPLHVFSNFRNFYAYNNNQTLFIIMMWTTFVFISFIRSYLFSSKPCWCPTGGTIPWWLSNYSYLLGLETFLP